VAKITNQFSWSFTRYKVFNECRRQYYHHYYGYWDGWNDAAPDRARLTYRLKNMMSAPMWVGDLVHRMVERIVGDLRNRELNSLDSYPKQARTLLNREWTQSIEKKWQWKPKYNLNLFEHYYGVEITPEERIAVRDKVYRCLENFMGSEIFAELGDLRPDDWKSLEKLEQFVVGDAPVFLKIDCAVGREGILTIYDWKTGRESEETAVQLGCYALYAFHVWRVPPEKQRLISFYLASNEVRQHAPSAEGLIETKDLILRSMQEMAAVLDSSIEKNRATEENFPMTPRRSTCQRCFFRELCFSTREWNADVAKE